MPELTTRTEPPGAVIIEPGTITPGRARGVPPLRREGPAKLTGAAKYADDLVFPGAWYGATIRSQDAHATFVELVRDPTFDWSTVIVVTAADIPGENVVSSIQSDQPILVPIGGEILHHAEPLALVAAPDRATLRAARHALTATTAPLPAVFDPLASDHVFAAYELGAGDPDAAFAAADFVLEGEYRVGHQEQLYIENNAMIAVPSDDGGVTVHGSLQCPYYVHTALKRGLAIDDAQARVEPPAGLTAGIRPPPVGGRPADGEAGVTSGTPAAIAQSSDTVFPALSPPCRVTPFRVRDVTFTVTPL